MSPKTQYDGDSSGKNSIAAQLCDYMDHKHTFNNIQIYN